MSETRRKGVIVVVDDELAVRILFQIALERRGHAVAIAANITDGLATCAARRPDIVIVDMFMGGGTGLELIRALKAKTPALRVIAITGGTTWEGFDVLVSAKDAGAEVTLRKPIPTDVIVEAVQGLLDDDRSVTPRAAGS